MTSVTAARIMQDIIGKVMVPSSLGLTEPKLDTVHAQ